jgi:hypothetical protein
VIATLVWLDTRPAHLVRAERRLVEVGRVPVERQAGAGSTSGRRGAGSRRRTSSA